MAGSGRTLTRNSSVRGWIYDANFPYSPGLDNLEFIVTLYFSTSLIWNHTIRSIKLSIRLSYVELYLATGSSCLWWHPEALVLGLYASRRTIRALRGGRVSKEVAYVATE